MKISYDRESDILLIDQGQEGDVIDYAEEAGSIIIHFTKGGKPVLLEILDASELLTAVIKSLTVSQEAVEV
ncbi:MAG: DUF2283 domain-containing protein [Nitrospirota bacterium]